jgi:hypothetical protein
MTLCGMGGLKVMQLDGLRAHLMYRFARLRRFFPGMGARIPVGVSANNPPI